MLVKISHNSSCPLPDPQVGLRCVHQEPLDPDLGGACRAAGGGGGAVGVNHMNVPPEQIRSDGAVRTGRP